jgi:lipoprotein-releasing system ATP-binding protein
MLNIKNLSKNYDKTTVLKDFNLEINQGESISIVGNSGSGKSTLLNILGGIDKISSGEIIFDGLNLNNLNEKQLTEFRAKNLGFVYQFHHLLQDFTALENVCMPLFIQKIDKKTAEKKAKNILKKVGLKDKFNNFPNELSGGQRQRVAIARALVSNPKLVLADEPTGNLDSENAQKVMDLLLELQKENNSSLVIVTHDKNLSQKTDRVVKI